jgi:hypothetical protein
MNDLWRTKTVTCVGYALTLLQGSLSSADVQTLPLIWDCAINSPDEQVVSMAGRGIIHMAESDPIALADWLERSRSAEAWVRLAAARAAGEERHQLQAVGTRLCALVNGDSDPSVVAAAVAALVTSDCMDETEWLGDAEGILFGTGPQRWRMAWALLPSNEVHADRLALVIRACGNDAPVVRAAAISALSEFLVNHSMYRMEDAAEPWWRAIVERLDDPDRCVRLLAAKAVRDQSDQWGDSFTSRFPGATARARGIDTSGVEFDPSMFE